jgi:hypothetical protein
MKIAFMLILLIGSCSGWRHHQDVQALNYHPTYTDDCFTEGSSIIIQGRYQNKNLYCINPQLYCIDSSTRFATIDITINDTIHLPYDSLAGGGYEIPLHRYNFKQGDSVNIVIRHYAGGVPKVLNPEVR